MMISRRLVLKRGVLLVLFSMSGAGCAVAAEPVLVTTIDLAEDLAEIIKALGIWVLAKSIIGDVRSWLDHKALDKIWRQFHPLVSAPGHPAASPRAGVNSIVYPTLVRTEGGPESIIIVIAPNGLTDDAQTFHFGRRAAQALLLAAPFAQRDLKMSAAQAISALTPERDIGNECLPQYVPKVAPNEFLVAQTQFESTAGYRVVIARVDSENFSREIVALYDVAAALIKHWSFEVKGDSFTAPSVATGCPITT